MPRLRIEDHRGVTAARPGIRGNARRADVPPAPPPRYIALGLGDNQPWLVGTSQTSDEYVRDDFPQLLLFLQENYQLVRNFGIMVLFERLPVAV